MICFVLMAFAANPAPIHAPPPCTTPLELRALTAARYPTYADDPLRNCSDEEFEHFLQGTLDTYSGSSGLTRQDWLNEFVGLLENLRGGAKISPEPARYTGTRKRLLAVIIADFHSDPPRSQERAIKALLRWGRAYSDIMNLGINELVYQLKDPDPLSGIAAAGVLQYIAKGGSDITGEGRFGEITAETSWYFPNRLGDYEHLAKPEVDMMTAALNADPEAAQRLVPLGFDHGSTRAIWLIGLLPKEKAFELLQDRVSGLKCDGRLNLALQVLKRADAARLDDLMDKAAPKMLPQIETILSCDSGSMTGEQQLYLDHLAQEQPDRMREWLWDNLTNEANRVDSRQDLAAWALSSTPELIEQLAVYAMLPDPNPYVKPYAVLALAKTDPQAALPLLRECYTNQPPADCDSPLRRDWPSMLSDALIAAGDTEYMDEMLARARAATHPEARLNDIANVVRRTRTEQAILALADEMRSNPDADMYFPFMETTEWPSQKAKDAYYDCVRGFLDKPRTRYRAAQTLLKGLGKDAFPDIAKALSATNPMGRSEILAVVLQGNGRDYRGGLAFLTELQESTTDPAFKEQIGHYLPQKQAPYYNPNSQDTSRVPILPSLTNAEYSIMKWWQVLSVGGLLAALGVLSRISHRPKVSPSASNGAHPGKRVSTG